jgi:hypothetical protein
MFRSLLPSRQGIIDNLWGGLIVAGVLAIIGAIVGTAWGLISGGRMVMQPILLEVLYFVGVLAIAVGLCLLAIRWLEKRTNPRATRSMVESQVTPPIATLTIEEMRAQVEAADVQAKEDEEREGQRQIDQERPDLDRFREIYPQVSRAVEYASEYVVSDLLLAPSNRNPGHSLIYNLLEAYVIPPCKRAKELLDIDLEIAAPGPLAVIIPDLQRLLSAYGLLVAYIERAARAILGPREFYESEGYAGLRQRHRECLTELRTISHRSGFGALTDSLAPLYDLLGPEPLTPAEKARRHGIMVDLRKQFISTRPDVAPDIVAQTAWPPTDWMNAKLEQMGELWRL